MPQNEEAPLRLSQASSRSLYKYYSGRETVGDRFPVLHFGSFSRRNQISGFIMDFFLFRDRPVYYYTFNCELKGFGSPLFLLHGNTASAKMFNSIIDLYKNDFKLILIDFLGHGNSERLKEFPADFWYDQAMQVIGLINLKNYEKVNIIGTSGGALSALNVALERGDLINKAIADSFEGEKSLDSITKTIFAERQQAKSQEESRMFWQYCHGDDWESIVNNDTDVIIRHDKYIKNFFHKDLSQLNVPVMLSASLKDEYAEIVDMEKTYKILLTKIPNGKLHLFSTGGHPAMLSNAKEFSGIAKEFFMGYK